MPKGKITEWNDERGFGFILPEDSGHKVFFHISNFPQRTGRPKVGLSCAYKTIKTDRGDKAVDISPISTLDRLGLGDAESRSSWMALLFLAGVVMLMIAGRVNFLVPLIYVVATLLSFYCYEQDKIKAEKGAWRISEAQLHFLSLIGGWPGALIAQQRYRHKTQKAEFRARFWVTVTVNCTALAAISLFGLPSQATVHFIAGWIKAYMAIASRAAGWT